jgi:tRNA(adenine34) deaminase
MKNHYEHFMQKTIQMASHNPRAPYASIIVYDNQDVLCQSVNDAHHHPLMHGELSAIYALFFEGFNGDLSKLALYTTAEPCPMCASAIYWANIPKIIYGTSIPFLHNLFNRQIQIRAQEAGQTHLN